MLRKSSWLFFCLLFGVRVSPDSALGWRSEKWGIELCSWRRKQGHPSTKIAEYWWHGLSVDRKRIASHLPHQTLVSVTASRMGGFAALFKISARWISAETKQDVWRHLRAIEATFLKDVLHAGKLQHETHDEKRLDHDQISVFVSHLELLELTPAAALRPAARATRLRNVTAFLLWSHCSAYVLLYLQVVP